jgi:hypothetical protein
MTYTTAEAQGALRILEDHVLHNGATRDIAPDALDEIRRLRRETKLARFPEPDWTCRPSSPHAMNEHRDGLD